MNTLAVVVYLLVEHRLRELLVLRVAHFLNLAHPVRRPKFLLLLLFLELALDTLKFADLVQQFHCLGLLLFLVVVQLVDVPAVLNDLIVIC